MLRRWMVSCLLAVVSAVLPAPALADGGEVIRSLQVAVDIGTDGRSSFAETVVYDFGAILRHGMIRAIPRWDELPDGRRRLYDLNIGTVTMDGAPVPFTVSDEGPFRMLTIGDADRTVSGTHTYGISFSIADALTPLTAADLSNAPGVGVGDVEFYWDLIGDGWQVPILVGEATVRAPATALLVRCYTGPTGSTSDCPHIANQTSTRFGPVAVQPGSALTAVVALPRAAFSAIQQPNITDAPPPWATQFLSVIRFSGPLGLLLLLALLVRVRARRATTTTVPVTDFVVFEPPLRLAPAAMAVAWKGTFDGRVLTATLLDLAARGAITIAPSRRKRITVTRTGRQVALSDWEQQVLDGVLHGSAKAEVGKYDAKLAKAVKQVGSGLKAAAEGSGIRNRGAWRARTPWIVAVVLGAFVAFMAVPAAAAPSVCAVLLPLGLALLIAGGIGWRTTPLIQTEASAGFLSQVLGFRRLLDTDAAAARREFAHRSGLEPVAIFATMLPFAVIYGVDEAWAGAFPDLEPAQLAAYGLGFASAHDIHRDVTAATRALASAMTSPSSSGSGSSGGSSGGGGGGGGGGSW